MTRLSAKERVRFLDGLVHVTRQRDGTLTERRGVDLGDFTLDGKPAGLPDGKEYRTCTADDLRQRLDALLQELGLED